MTGFSPDGVGQWTEPDTFEVTAERIAQYAAATNDPIPAHLSGDIAPPVFAIVPVFMSLIPAALAVAPAEYVMRIVHGMQDFRFHQVIRPGMTLVSRAKPIGFGGNPKGTRVAVYIESRSSDGSLVNEQWVTSFFRNIDAGPLVGSLAPVHSFTQDDPVANVVSHVDDDQTFRYSLASGDPMPIHLDEEIARMAGLPGIIAHGLCTMAFTSWAVLTEVANGDTARLRRLAVRFNKPVLPGQDIATQVWRSGPNYTYETKVGETVVIRDGYAEIAED
ncbi:MaoC/PaaZ C-terminal domain-containing protein [Actinocrispum wychmicini]|uniref:Acyl dehydratase n=1 Tax=Actinocrispum wychmicini TaxID=1213861 RepID=A0A4R2K247_9PSEU|nr:MaoC/PaaZ C-terminal domain-containing protein [Actinocrispum wychmicini]TCO65787.1 acyl dehydratase [Actinocrispum wychmicini]